MAVAAEARRLASPALHTLARRRVAELGALALGLAALGLLVALLSYHSGDPSLDTASAGPVANLAGRPGAVVADLLLQAFGMAGALPGLALLAWAWRIGSHRGLSSLTLRLAALLAALPATGAVLAAIPDWHGRPLDWPAGGGLGGAAGRLAGAAAIAAGRDLLGPLGVTLVVTLGTALAGSLVVLALGLSRSEWRAAGLAARQSVQHGRAAAGLFARFSARAGRFGVAVLDRLNGTRPEAPAPNIIAPAAQRTAAPEPTAPPPRVTARINAAAPKKAAPARQDSLPLDGPWRLPPLSLLAAAPARATSGAPSAEALQANARLLEIGAGRLRRAGAASWRSGPAPWSRSTNSSPRPASAARA